MAFRTLPAISDRFAIENGDVRKVAVQLLIIHSVTDDKDIGDVKPAIGDRQVNNSSRRFIEKRTDVDAGRVALAQDPEQVVCRQTGVDDVFDQEDMSARDTLFQILGDAYHAGLWLTRIG